MKTVPRLSLQAILLMLYRTRGRRKGRRKGRVKVRKAAEIPVAYSFLKVSAKIFPFLYTVIAKRILSSAPPEKKKFEDCLFRSFNCICKVRRSLRSSFGNYAVIRKNNTFYSLISEENLSFFLILFTSVLSFSFSLQYSSFQYFFLPSSPIPSFSEGPFLDVAR
jgi:hypothetical protein